VRLRFGDCVLDTAVRELRRGGQVKLLSPRAFRLLEVLTERRPDAIAQEELRGLLWPDTVAGGTTLARLVHEVRAALGDSVRPPRYVRTVHRFGYAFGGPATDLSPNVQTSPDCVRCWIVWEFGQVALRNGEHLLGRDGDVAVWLESPTVSRHHARIRVSEEGATIEDLGSKNGTALRGESVTTPSPLADGDEIRLGSVLVKFRRPATGASTDTQR